MEEAIWIFPIFVIWQSGDYENTLLLVSVDKYYNNSLLETLHPQPFNFVKSVKYNFFLIIIKLND